MGCLHSCEDQIKFIKWNHFKTLCKSIHFDAERVIVRWESSKAFKYSVGCKLLHPVPSSEYLQCGLSTLGAAGIALKCNVMILLPRERRGEREKSFPWGRAIKGSIRQGANILAGSPMWAQREDNVWKAAVLPSEAFLLLKETQYLWDTYE